MASATAPKRSTETIDNAFLVPAAPEGPCAFPVELHFTAQVESTHFFDDEGNEVRTLVRSFGASVTYSANGKSIADKAGGIAHLTIDPATGAMTVVTTGLLGHLLAPGEGILAQDSGRIVFFYESPDDEVPDVLFESGRLDGGPFPAVCGVLAP